MSLNVIIPMLVLAGAQATGQLAAPASSDCPQALLAVLSSATAEVARGDYPAAAARVNAAYDLPDASACPAVRLAAWAWRGWASAERAAALGGAPVPLAEVTAASAAVTRFGPPRSEAAYAAAVLHAAAAAAQDERDEMQVWLDEARAIAARLRLVGTPALWPLPIDLAEGELWHGVDDYELAEAAFMRALAAADTAAAWHGLGRARDRRGDQAGACDAYRRVEALLAATAVPGPLATEARAYLRRCRP